MAGLAASDAPATSAWRRCRVARASPACTRLSTHPCRCPPSQAAHLRVSSRVRGEWCIAPSPATRSRRRACSTAPPAASSCVLSPAATRRAVSLWPASRLDLNLVERLAVVDADDGADHLGHDDHVAQVGAHGLGLLPGGSRLLLLGDSGKRASAPSAGVGAQRAALRSFLMSVSDLRFRPRWKLRGGGARQPPAPAESAPAPRPRGRGPPAGASLCKAARVRGEQPRGGATLEPGSRLQALCCCSAHCRSAEASGGGRDCADAGRGKPRAAAACGAGCAPQPRRRAGGGRARGTAAQARPCSGPAAGRGPRRGS